MLETNSLDMAVTQQWNSVARKWTASLASYLCVFIISLLCTTGIANAETRDEVIFFFNDALGSAVAAVNEEGELCWSEVYTPYGDKTVNDDLVSPVGCGIVGEERGYTGHTEDVNSDLVYMQQRYYDPSIGRFLSIDPLDASPNDPRTYNRYAYAHNNPYKYIDPDGRQADDPLDDSDNDGTPDFEDNDTIDIVDLLSTDPLSIGPHNKGGASYAPVKGNVSSPDKNVTKGAGRGKNKLQPNQDAVGDHTDFQRGTDGKIYKYENYEKTSTGHWNPVKRYDGGKPDGSAGAPHFNKQTGETIPTPHVQGKSVPGGVRHADTWEIPK